MALLPMQLLQAIQNFLSVSYNLTIPSHLLWEWIVVTFALVFLARLPKLPELLPIRLEDSRRAFPWKTFSEFKEE